MFRFVNKYTAKFFDRDAVLKSSDINYISDLVLANDLRIESMKNAYNSEPGFFYLRHDVDDDIERSLLMSRLEYKHNLTATYFLLTPCAYEHLPKNYYGYLENGRIIHSKKLIDYCKAFQDFGHDVGLHNDLVALSLKTGVRPDILLEQELEYFRKNGIEIKGTAAHGNPLARLLKFNNRELFYSCVRKGWEVGRELTYKGNRVKLHSISMSDYDLEYEAYSLPRDSRVADSGGHWAGKIAGFRLPKEIWRESFCKDTFITACKNATESNGVKAFSILTHPQHWTF